MRQEQIRKHRVHWTLQSYIKYSQLCCGTNLKGANTTWNIVQKWNVATWSTAPQPHTLPLWLCNTALGLTKMINSSFLHSFFWTLDLRRKKSLSGSKYLKTFHFQEHFLPLSSCWVSYRREREGLRAELWGGRSQGGGQAGSQEEDLEDEGGWQQNSSSVHAQPGLLVAPCARGTDRGAW